MSPPPILFDPKFVPLVGGGWGLAVLGAVCLLAAAIFGSVLPPGIRRHLTVTSGVIRGD